MIILHRLNGDEFILNANHIEIMEANPDTLITLTNDRKYVVAESIDEIIIKIREYNRSLFNKEEE